MTLAVLAGYTPDDAAEDPQVRVKELADRKVRKLLDETSLAPFLAALELKSAAWREEWSGERVGLVTVSGDEQRAPLPPKSPDQADYFHTVMTWSMERNPAYRLRLMANNTVCQAAIAAELLGPSLHFVGAGDTLRLALVTVGTWLETGACDVAIVVAFDRPQGAQFAVPTGAAGIVVGVGSGQVADGEALAEMAEGVSALEAMTRLVTETRSRALVGISG